MKKVNKKKAIPRADCVFGGEKSHQLDEGLFWVLYAAYSLPLSILVVCPPISKREEVTAKVAPAAIAVLMFFAVKRAVENNDKKFSKF